jgi:hypothetical protein
LVPEHHKSGRTYVEVEVELRMMNRLNGFRPLERSI